LAVIGVESNYNPFANSPTGAKGLMQVLPDIHSEQFAPYGGPMAIFDPKTNLRIGVKILKESIDITGSLVEGLRLYKAGEDSVSQESEYIARVMAEQTRLKDAISKPATAPQKSKNTSASTPK
jgi:soluble lytic murein transglycosylase-like protein